MESVRIVENKALLLAGCLVEYKDRSNDWAKWEEMDSKADVDPKYAHHHLVNDHHAHSVFFYPKNNIYVFTGLEVTGEVVDTAWEYMQLPSATYAVFELDYKVDQGPQYEAIENWIKDNKGVYKRIEWDANGKVDLSTYAIYIYKHDDKFKDSKIVECWIPFVKQ